MAFPPKDREDFERAMKENELGPDRFMNIVNICQANVAADRDAILRLIKGRGDVNDAVMNPLKHFYLSAGDTVAGTVDASTYEGGSMFVAIGSVFQAVV